MSKIKRINFYGGAGCGKSTIEVISVTKLVADAIWRIHSTTGSISELLS